MPLPPTHVKEKLSIAYVQAIAAAAGADYNPEGQPEYGLDCSIKLVTVLPTGEFSYTGHFLHCQIKSTTNWIEQDDCIL
jgi:hypothetical protein